jgi:glycolate oxidase FAD binding subunit
MTAPDSLTIDGVGPMPVVRPASAAEVGEIVRRCAADGTAIYPVGGGTMLDYGLPPARPGLAVDLRSLDRVIDFPASDMTITVEAGITIARLAEITRAEGLHLPIDVPEPDRATLGGAIACNVSGPRRYGYGTFRDYVLGITTVNDRGEQVSAGGRVVKNVAGYDLMKLHTGALGTLGIITQVTLKLRPVQEEREVVTFGCREPLSAMLDLLHRSQTRPVIIDVADGESGFVSDSPNPSKNSICPWQVFVGFEGSSEVVTWQAEQLCREVEPSDPQRLLRVHGSNAEHHYRFLMSHHTGAGNSLMLRASLAPSGVVPFLIDALQADLDVWTHAQAGNGVVRVGFTGGAIRDNLVMFREAVNSLLNHAAAHGGNVVIERCPSEWKKSLPVWGRPPADLALQKAVKRALDPNNLFNPGRFVTDAF